MNTQNSQGAAENQLRKNSLGVGAVTFLVVSAAAPLTAVAGGVPLSMMLGNGPGIPLTFLLVTGILLLFAVGYVAMARHIRNAGAFYAYTAQGLGGLMGGAAALIAILAYNAMQVGVLGLFGAATSSTPCCRWPCSRLSTHPSGEPEGQPGNLSFMVCRANPHPWRGHVA